MTAVLEKSKEKIAEKNSLNISEIKEILGTFQYEIRKHLYQLQGVAEVYGKLEGNTDLELKPEDFFNFIYLPKT